MIARIPRNDSPQPEIHRRVRLLPVIGRFEPVGGVFPALHEVETGGVGFDGEACFFVFVGGFVVAGLLVWEPAEGGG